jgi:hypothetical protein
MTIQRPEVQCLPPGSLECLPPGNSYCRGCHKKPNVFKAVFFILSYDLQMVTGTGRVGRSSPLCGKRRPARTGPVSSVSKASTGSVAYVVCFAAAVATSDGVDHARRGRYILSCTTYWGQKLTDAHQISPLEGNDHYGEFRTRFSKTRDG